MHNIHWYGWTLGNKQWDNPKCPNFLGGEWISVGMFGHVWSVHVYVCARMHAFVCMHTYADACPATHVLTFVCKLGFGSIQRRL